MEGRNKRESKGESGREDRERKRSNFDFDERAQLGEEAQVESGFAFLSPLIAVQLSKKTNDDHCRNCEMGEQQRKEGDKDATSEENDEGKKTMER